MGKMIGFVDGASLFLVVALLIFLSVFIAIGFYLLTMNKETIAEIEVLPLEDNKR